MRSRLAVWFLLVSDAIAFSTHLRQANVPTHTEAKLESAANAPPISRFEEVLSIIRVRATAYLDLWQSLFTRSESRTHTISGYNNHQNDFVLSTPSTISLYAGHMRSRCLQLVSSYDATRFVVVMAFVVSVLLACICFLPMDEIVSPRPLHELYETHTCTGSWARTYKNADENDKQALELLFRCHIIKQDEFRDASTYQPHIEECIWIGRNMLAEKPLEEWLQRCSEAQYKFRESLNECSEAKMKERLERSSEVRSLEESFNAENSKVRLGGQSGLDFTLGSPGPRAHGQYVHRASPRQSPQGPYSPQYDSGTFAKDTSATAYTPEQHKLAILNSPNEKIRLLHRCSEIMHEYDRERRAARQALTPPATSPYVSPPTTSDLARWQIPASNQWASAPAGSIGVYPQTARQEELSSSAVNKPTNSPIS